MFYKIVYNQSCVKIPEYIERVDYTTLPKTRKNLIIIENEDSLTYKCKLRPLIDAFINSFFHRSYILWNDLPLKIRQINHFKSFKIKLVNHVWEVIKQAEGIG